MCVTSFDIKNSELCSQKLYVSYDSQNKQLALPEQH